MDTHRRVTALQQSMRDHAVDLAVFGLGPSQQYLTGGSPVWRGQVDLWPQQRVLFVPAEGATGSSLDEVSNMPMVRKIGLSRMVRGSLVSQLGTAFPDASFVDVEPLLAPVRMVKEPEEIERLKAVAELTDRVMEDVVSRFRPGVSANEVMADIEGTAMNMGAEAMSFPPFCGFMKSGAGATDDITNVSPDEGLAPNTAICFDVGFVLNGYASDWGRSVYWGKPDPSTTGAYRALVESMLEVVGALKDQAFRACDVYPALERALDARGYGDDMRLRLGEHKGMGHSIGVEVHEEPWLSPANEQPLLENMVIAIEPKLWKPGEYYLRLEEIVWIRKQDAVFLTNFDRSLFQL